MSLFQKAGWRTVVARYQNPSLWRSFWQLINTLVPYFVLWLLMIWSLKISYWITLLLAAAAAGFLVRIFIIFHDCGHGSFLKSQKINDIVGSFLGVLLFTPYYFWRHEHAVHHSSAGNLDQRGVGDIWTLTVKEYLAADRWTRLKYRLARNPLIMLIVGPLYLFLVRHRFACGNAGPRERQSVRLTNLWVLVSGALMSWAIGFKAYFAIQFPVVLIASSLGVWLFYVQHQFEGVYWEKNKEWDYLDVALKGSSYYKLPKIFQWFTGNIGFHHIHHLSPRIPNYLLEKCYKENTLFQQIKPITLFSSLKSLTFRLWDEENRRLVGFRFLKTLRGKAHLLNCT